MQDRPKDIGEMTGFLEKHSGNALLVAILGNVVAIGVACLSAYFAFQINKTSQDNNVRFEALARFDQSNASIVQTAGEFISAVNSSGNLSPEKEKIKTVAAQEINAADQLRKFFPDSKVVDKYQDALQRFNTVAQKTNDSTEMRAWSESFGNVVDSKTMLSKELYKKLGVTI